MQTQLTSNCVVILEGNKVYEVMQKEDPWQTTLFVI